MSVLNNKLMMVLFTAGCIAATSAFSQNQRLPGVVDKPVPDSTIPDSHSLDKKPAEPFEKAPERSKTDYKNTSIATIKSVSFEGNTVIDSQTLQMVVAKHIGKGLSDKTLADIKYDVKKAFYDKGYILVRVVAQPQDFSTGKLKISIFEAKVGEVKIDNNNVLNSYIASGMSKSVKAGDVIREDNIESMISDLNSLGNVKAKLTLTPGKALSTTDLGINLTDAKEDVQTVSVNNYGSELTGKVVTGAHLEHSNLFKLGETLNVDAQISENNLWNAGVGLVTPIGFRNVNLETNYLHAENDIGGRLEALRASGKTDLFNVALSSKLLNTRDNLSTVRFGFESRTHESFLADLSDTKDDLRKAYSDVSYLHRGANKVVYGSAKISKGIDAFGASQKGDASATRSSGDQEAWIFEPTVLANIRPFSFDGTVKLLAHGQLASNNLLSSDLFALGGYGSVRGIPVAQEAAEDGFSFTAQYDHVLPIHVDKVTFKAGPFLDGGAVYNRIPGTVVDSHFYSAGLGFETDAKIIPVGDTVVRLDWAHPIGSYDSTRISDDTFYFNLKQNF